MAVHWLVFSSCRFQSVFMMQAAENLCRHHGCIVGQVMSGEIDRHVRSLLSFRDSRPQGRVRKALIVMHDPLPQDPSQVFLSQRNHKVQALTTDRPNQAQ
jgi:hypothetical protein